MAIRKRTWQTQSRVQAARIVTYRDESRQQRQETFEHTKWRDAQSTLRIQRGNVPLLTSQARRGVL
jgi:hypothetical protein